MLLLDSLAARLAAAGMDLIGTTSVTAWDAHAPAQLRAESLLSGARSVIVVGSAGPRLWNAFRAAAPHSGEHPLDEFVTRALIDAESELSAVRARRFEASFMFEPRVDFRTLGRLAGLGDVGPFGLLIHPVHGPWFGLRGAWLVDCELPQAPLSSPCVGCAAPCVGSAGETTLDRSTAAMRLRCPFGTASRYSDEQLAYHHDGTRPPWLPAEQ
jgi:epoxyqueuosine reductase QueG